MYTIYYITYASLKKTPKIMVKLAKCMLRGIAMAMALTLRVIIFVFYNKPYMHRKNTNHS